MSALYTKGWSSRNSDSESISLMAFLSIIRLLGRLVKRPRSARLRQTGEVPHQGTCLLTDHRKHVQMMKFKCFSYQCGLDEYTTVLHKYPSADTAHADAILKDSV
jgi:hypothetical protein